jgi:hypothetical protein
MQEQILIPIIIWEREDDDLHELVVNLIDLNEKSWFLYLLVPHFSLCYFSRYERFSLSSSCLIWIFSILIAAPFTPWLVLWICSSFVFGVVGCPGFHSVHWLCRWAWSVSVSRKQAHHHRFSVLLLHRTVISLLDFFCPHSLGGGQDQCY